VQPLARLADETEQRVPGDLARVDATRPLPRADPTVMLDVTRVQIERHRLPVEQRMRTRKQLVEHAIQLRDVAEREAAQEATERRRFRKSVPAQKLPRRIAAQQRDVLQALAAPNQRLHQRQNRLRRRVAAPPLHHPHPIQQLAQPEPTGKPAHQHQARVRSDLLTGSGHPDQRRPPC
jgi:hypothetical protein